MLTMNLTADLMSGYSTAKNQDGALVFETWVLVKKDGRSDSELEQDLFKGEHELQRKTIGLVSPPDLI